MSELNIYQRMLKITDELQTVAKNLIVQTGRGNSYKAVGELDILNAVKPLEAKYGVYSYPKAREIIETSVIETETKDYVRKQLFMRVQTEYRFINVDNPTEYIDLISYGDGLDSGDKATGKAMTYCDKYALMKAYKISTGDDPDQNGSEEMKSYQNTTKQSKPVTATANQIKMISRLYTQDEIVTMLQRLNVPELSNITVQQASKMIEARKGK